MEGDALIGSLGLGGVPAIGRMRYVVRDEVEWRSRNRRLCREMKRRICKTRSHI